MRLDAQLAQLSDAATITSLILTREQQHSPNHPAATTPSTCPANALDGIPPGGGFGYQSAREQAMRAANNLFN